MLAFRQMALIAGLLAATPAFASAVGETQSPIPVSGIQVAVANGPCVAWANRCVQQKMCPYQVYDPSNGSYILKFKVCGCLKTVTVCTRYGQGGSHY